MRRLNALGVTGAVMLLGGATTFLTNNSILPLWVTWIVGPLLWYLGFAVMLVWGYHFFFGATAAEPAEQSRPSRVIVVRRQSSPTVFGAGPVGVMHEIPAMGAFIL